MDAREAEARVTRRRALLESMFVCLGVDVVEYGEGFVLDDVVRQCRGTFRTSGSIEHDV